jgi:hypothetical protein
VDSVDYRFGLFDCFFGMQKMNQEREWGRQNIDTRPRMPASPTISPDKMLAIKNAEREEIEALTALYLARGGQIQTVRQGERVTKAQAYPVD